MKKFILFPPILIISCLLPTTFLGQHNDTLSFIHITDTHISDLSGYHTDIASRREHYGKGRQPFIDFITYMPGKSGAAFITLTGDMIDFYEGETHSGNMKAGQIENFAESLSSSSVPVYMILGNHDIKSAYNSTAPGYDSRPYYASDEQARASWVRNVSCFRNGVYYSKTIKIDTTVYRLIFLDNSYYKEKQQRGAGVPFVMEFPQLAWLKNQLNESDTDIEIIFMHMPIPWGNPSEQSSSFPDFSIEDPGLYSLLSGHPSIRLILTGHEHDSALKDFQTKKGQIMQVMTGAFSRNINNWRLIHLTKDNVAISETGSTEIQEIIKIQP